MTGDYFQDCGITIIVFLLVIARAGVYRVWKQAVYSLQASRREFEIKNQPLERHRLGNIVPTLRRCIEIHLLNRTQLIAEHCQPLSSLLGAAQRVGRLELSEKNLGYLVMKNASCQVPILGLNHCGHTACCCPDLTSLLSHNRSPFAELDLSKNQRGDCEVEPLSHALEKVDCTVWILRLWDCGLRASCSGDLASVFRQTQTLMMLNLSSNYQEGVGMKLLSKGRRDPRCKVQILELSNCGIMPRFLLCLQTSR